MLHVISARCVAHIFTQATWVYVLEAVRGAVKRLSKILNCALECNYFYYCYYYYYRIPGCVERLQTLKVQIILCSISDLRVESANSSSFVYMYTTFWTSLNKLCKYLKNGIWRLGRGGGYMMCVSSEVVVRNEEEAVVYKRGWRSWRSNFSLNNVARKCNQFAL